MLEEYSRESPDTVVNLFLIHLHLPVTLSWKNTAWEGMWEDGSVEEL